jgi:hypothetical protein
MDKIRKPPRANMARFHQTEEHYRNHTMSRREEMIWLVKDKPRLEMDCHKDLPIGFSLFEVLNAF